MHFKQACILVIMLLVLPVFALACAPCSTPAPAPTHAPTQTPTPSSGGWTTYNADNGLGGNIVAALVVGPDGALWVGLRDEDKAGGVSRFDPSTGPGQGGENLTRYTMDDGLPYRMVLSIAAGPDGVMWFGTFGAGVSRFDGQNWTTYKKEEGLPHNEIRSISVGSDDAVWLGTKHGVSRFDGEN
jgi:ligand-binding sensor domain-containing protein